MQPSKRIVLVGGGTSGHILPLLAVRKELQRLDRFDFLYIGSKADLTKSAITGENIYKKSIVCGKLRRNFSLIAFFQNVLDAFLVVIGTFQSFVILSRYNPDLIFSKSGYVSIPVILAARLLSIPVVIHESDVVGGLATRLAASQAHAILTAFPSSIYSVKIRRKAIHTGLPLRSEFDRKSGLGGKYILITGGSQGARELNTRIMDVLPQLLCRHRVIHLTGDLDFKRVHLFRNALPEKLKKNYRITAFEKNIAHLMKKAKLIIQRAGATTIFESAALGKKTLLMPITSGVASHQISNALFLNELKMAEIISQTDSSHDILSKIHSILKEKEASAIDGLHFPNSAMNIAKLLNDFLDYFALKKIRKVFMIGSGGVSMKAISQILKEMGINVKGSDLKTGGHSASNINISYDLVVYSSAAGPGSQAEVEHQRAKELGIRTIKRSEMIGWLMKGFRGISVAGMHGKTTISSVIARMLENSSADPTYMIGAPSSNQAPSSKLGNGIDFVSEACEYDGSFLDFKTKVAVISNIEKEHLDYFKGGIGQIIKEFGKFVQSIFPGGALIYYSEDKNISKVIGRNAKYLADNKIQLISYGFGKGNTVVLSGYDVSSGVSTFKLNGTDFKTFKIGKHFALNCAAAYGVGKFIGLDNSQIIKTIARFKGAARRFELLGEKRGVLIYDDYGHHPTELRETMVALNELYPDNRKIVIFQPHQQKRFNDFYGDFVKEIKNAPIDVIGILPVYRVPGRDERQIKNINDLIREVNSPRVIPLDNYEMATDFLGENLRKGDILMTMGATDVFKIGRTYLRD